MVDSSATARLVGSGRRVVSLLIVIAASAALMPAAAHAASPGPAACQEYSVCGGPTGPTAGASSQRTPGSGGGDHAHVSSWVRLPLVSYPVTPAVAALVAAVLAAFAVALAVGLARRRGSAHSATSAPGR